MACISPDGKPTASGTKMLRALKVGRGTPEEISQEAALPLFRVRGGLREFVEAGLAEQKGDSYVLSAAGDDLLATLPA